jgi:hypothetical protein
LIDVDGKMALKHFLPFHCHCHPWLSNAQLFTFLPMQIMDGWTVSSLLPYLLCLYAFLQHHYCRTEYLVTLKFFFETELIPSREWITSVKWKFHVFMAI